MFQKKEKLEYRNKIDKITELSESENCCPFINKPFKDCYCIGTNSRSALLTINFCGGNFEKCEIYKNGKGEKNLHGIKIKSNQEQDD